MVYRNYVQAGIAPGANTVTTSAIAANTIQPWQLSNSLLNPTVNTYTANGTGTTYTLSFTPPSANAVVVTVNGITQNFPENYSTNDTVLTFTDPPAVNSVIRVLQQAMIGTSIVPIDGSVTTSKLASGLTLSGSTTLTGNQVIQTTDNSNAALRITQLGTGNALLVEDSDNPDSSPFIVNANGSVGIGTTTPIGQLTISGTTSTSMFFVNTSADADETTWRMRNFNSANTNYFEIASVNDVVSAGSIGYRMSKSSGNSVDVHQFYTASAERMRITATGQLLVGTTSGTGAMQITGASGSRALTLNAPTNGPSLTFEAGGTAFADIGSSTAIFGTGSATDLVIGTRSGYPMIFGTSNTERMRILSDGKVGINNTNPLTRLDIKGDTNTFAGMAKIYLTDSNGNAASRNWSIGNGGSAFGALTFAVSSTKDGNPGDGAGLNNLALLYTGAVVLQNGNVNANGVGITFPATQSASSDANTLDDYEEGTWTPGISMASGTSTGSSGSGTYIKIGRQVTVTVGLAVGTISAGGEIDLITGLPFTVRTGNDQSVGLSRENANTGFGWELRANSGGAHILVRKVQDNSAVIATGMVFVGTVTYFTA